MPIVGDEKAFSQPLAQPSHYLNALNNFNTEVSAADERSLMMKKLKPHGVNFADVSCLALGRLRESQRQEKKKQLISHENNRFVMSWIQCGFVHVFGERKFPSIL